MHLSKHHLAILAIGLCTVIWSAAAPLFKWAMQDTPPFTLLFFRFLLATIFMLIIVNKRIKIRFEDFYKILLLALTGITSNIGLYYMGLSLAPSINAPIIASTIPVFLIFGSILFLHEKPKSKIIFGTLVSLIGVFIVIIRPMQHLSLFGSIIGNSYFILSVISLVTYTILLKLFKLKYSSSTLIFWIFLIATVTFFPPFIFEAHAMNSLSTLDFKGTFGILYGAIFSSILGQIFYNYGVKNLKSDEIGIFTYLGPIVTALVALPLLHEQITFSYLLGALFVFLGLFIAEVKMHRYHLLHRHFNNVDDSWLESGP